MTGLFFCIETYLSIVAGLARSPILATEVSKEGE